jgi:plastocyanin
LLPLFAIIGSILVIGAILISSEVLPEETAKDFNAMTDVSMQSDLQVIKEPTLQDNVYIYAINDVARQGLGIAQSDARVKEILASSKDRQATVTIAAVQPTLLVHRETGELLHSPAGQVIITGNWQTVNSVLYSDPKTFEQLEGDTVESYQQIWNVQIDLDESRVTEVSQRADRAVSSTVVANVIRANINMFVPNIVIVEKGSAVRWSNPSSLPHNVVGTFNQTVGGEEISIDSGFIDPNNSWQYRFEQEGVFNYLCTIHSEEGMRGTIIVTP